MTPDELKEKIRDEQTCDRLAISDFIGRYRGYANLLLESAAYHDKETGGSTVSDRCRTRAETILFMVEELELVSKL